MIYYFIYFPVLIILHMDQKAPDLKNTYFNKKVFPIRRKFYSNMDKYSWTYNTGLYGWIYSVLYSNQHDYNFQYNTSRGGYIYFGSYTLKRKISIKGKENGTDKNSEISSIK